MKTIPQIQDELIKLGYQFQEQIYNDGKGYNSECSMEMTKSKDPCAFLISSNATTVGWGRYSRQYCWEKALEYAKKFKSLDEES